MRKMIKTIMIIGLGTMISAQAAQAAHFDWNLCYDTTTSVPATQFSQYPSIVRRSVLQLLQPGDQLSILRIDAVNATPIELETRLSRFERQVGETYQMIREIPQNKTNNTATDFGLILNHARKQIELNQKVLG